MHTIHEAKANTNRLITAYNYITHTHTHTRTRARAFTESFTSPIPFVYPPIHFLFYFTAQSPSVNISNPPPQVYTLKPAVQNHTAATTICAGVLHCRSLYFKQLYLLNHSSESSIHHFKDNQREPKMGPFIWSLTRSLP